METNILTPAGHLEERYFERMASSLGDKLKIVDYLPAIAEEPPVIVDIGAGGGEFAHYLATLGYKVFGLDVSPESIEKIDHFGDVHAVLGYANTLHRHLPENSVDVVVCSSVLHEVFSYGNEDGVIGDYRNIQEAFDSFRKVLKHNGLLIIRDGVKPDNWADSARIELLKDDFTVVNEYLKMSPFSNGEKCSTLGNDIELQEENVFTFTGNVQSVMEFAYTYTWGVENYHREARELYGIYTLNEYMHAIETAGFTIDEAYAYLQPGYPENLEKKIRLTVNGKESEWFDSNAIWVARKQ